MGMLYVLYKEICVQRSEEECGRYTEILHKVSTYSDGKHRRRYEYW